MIFIRIMLVRTDENASVEKLPIRASHRAVGIQARNNCRKSVEEGFGSADEDKGFIYSNR